MGNRAEADDFNPFVGRILGGNEGVTVKDRHIMSAFDKPHGELLIEGLESAVPCRNSTGSEKSDFHASFLVNH